MDRRTLRTPIVDRIVRRCLETESGCWIYQGADNGVGYGVIGSGGKEGRMVYTHRTMYEYFISEIPTDLVLDHLCRDRKCCNPWHLEPVPHRVNLLRGQGASAQAARRVACPQGHPYDDENTYRYPSDGSRKCKTCSREQQRQRRAQRKAA